MVIGGGPNNGANKHAPPPYTQHQCNTRYKVNHSVTNYTDITHVRLPDNKPPPPPDLHERRYLFYDGVALYPRHSYC